jgi:uncharacterized protein YbaR (Trm112 family)
MKRGSKIIICPECGTPHLAYAMRRVPFGWAIVCRVCGEVPWRAR